MVAGEIQRRWVAATSERPGHEGGDGQKRVDGQEGGDGRQHRRGHTHEHDRHAVDPHPDADGHRHGHPHARGIGSHTHLPPAGSTITWRGLFALGLAGGLIPSTSALLVLLGAIAAGRPTFGFVLVAAFGLGMAAVMVALGLALVVARDRLDRIPTAGGFRRVRAAMPLAASIVVFGFGIVLTAQALGSPPAL
jgi:ABC-type nickel/cobalt efflux system permease component RcnA